MTNEPHPINRPRQTARADRTSQGDDGMIICTWPSCGCTAKNQCGRMFQRNLVIDPMPRVDLTLPPPVGYVPRANYDALAARLAEVEKEREPDYCYDDEWEYTMPWGDRETLVEYANTMVPVPIYTLLKGPTKWAIEVPLTLDEYGDTDDSEIQWFDSEEAASKARKAALQTPQEAPAEPTPRALQGDEIMLDNGNILFGIPQPATVTVPRDLLMQVLDEVEKLRAALRDIADGMGEDDPREIGRYAPSIARAALTPKPVEG